MNTTARVLVAVGLAAATVSACDTESAKRRRFFDAIQGFIETRYTNHNPGAAVYGEIQCNSRDVRQEPEAAQLRRYCTEKGLATYGGTDDGRSP